MIAMLTLSKKKRRKYRKDQSWYLDDYNCQLKSFHFYSNFVLNLNIKKIDQAPELLSSSANFTYGYMDKLINIIAKASTEICHSLPSTKAP